MRNGLIYKLKQNGVNGNLLNLIIDFIDARKQRVILNTQYSSWASVEEGVPQGSNLGPLFFLIFINDSLTTLFQILNCWLTIPLSFRLSRILLYQQNI